VEGIRVHMLKQIEGTSRSGEGESDAPPLVTREGAALPRPPMLWLLVPVALLALLAFLSRS